VLPKFELPFFTFNANCQSFVSLLSRVGKWLMCVFCDRNEHVFNQSFKSLGVVLTRCIQLCLVTKQMEIHTPLKQVVLIFKNL
jgi:hypothetical protein